MNRTAARPLVSLLVLVLLLAVSLVAARSAAAATPALTVDPSAALSKDRTQVTITGTVVCDPLDDLSIALSGGSLFQVVGRIGIGAQQFVNVSRDCTGSPVPFAVTLRTFNGQTLKPGPANMGLFALTSDTFQQVIVTQPIRLR